MEKSNLVKKVLQNSEVITCRDFIRYFNCICGAKYLATQDLNSISGSRLSLKKLYDQQKVFYDYNKDNPSIILFQFAIFFLLSFDSNNCLISSFSVHNVPVIQDKLTNTNNYSIDLSPLKEYRSSQNTYNNQCIITESDDADSVEYTLSGNDMIQLLFKIIDHMEKEKVSN